jgi:hypothetical protein
MTANEHPDAIDMRIAGQLLAHKRMGQSAFDRLVPVFVDEAQMLISQIRCAVTASDLEGLRLTAHKLKGSASVIGAAEVCDLSRGLMMDAAGGVMPAAERVLVLDQALARFSQAAAGLKGK